MKKPALFVLCALLATTAPAAAGESVPQDDGLLRATDFAYEDINPASATFGEKLRLSDVYAEKGVVLNFLASWCGYCWKEIVYLEQMHKDGTVVVGVAADEHPAPPEIVLSLVARAEATIPILWVPEDDVPAMERAYGHGMLPATYLIDDEGRIRQLLQGSVSRETLLGAVDRHLRGAPPEPVEEERGSMGW